MKRQSVKGAFGKSNTHRWPVTLFDVATRFPACLAEAKTRVSYPLQGFLDSPSANLPVGTRRNVLNGVLTLPLPTLQAQGVTDPSGPEYTVDPANPLAPTNLPEEGTVELRFVKKEGAQ